MLAPPRERGYLRGGSSPFVSADAPPRAAIVQVRRAPLSNTLSIAGEFLPYQEVELHAKVAGYIRNINVDIGYGVRKGQVLAVLEIPELVAQLEAASAGVRHSQDEITHAQNEVSRAEAEYAALHAAATRLRQASEARPGLIAEQELDDATAKDRSTEAQVESAKSALATSASREQLEVSRPTGSMTLRFLNILADYSSVRRRRNLAVRRHRIADSGRYFQREFDAGSKTFAGECIAFADSCAESLAASVHAREPADIRVKATDQRFSGKVIRSTDSLDRSTVQACRSKWTCRITTNKLTPGKENGHVSLRVQKTTRTH